MSTALTLHETIDFDADQQGRPRSFTWRGERWNVIDTPAVLDVEFYPELTHGGVVVARWGFRAQTIDGSDVGSFESARVLAGWELTHVTFA